MYIQQGVDLMETLIRSTVEREIYPNVPILKPHSYCRLQIGRPSPTSVPTNDVNGILRRPTVL